MIFKDTLTYVYLFDILQIDANLYKEALMTKEEAAITCYGNASGDITAKIGGIYE